MKLNTKRTILVGFAFFLICTFWQAYDSIIPLILTNKFGMSQTWSGVIMAIDNILALFMLPLFGALSDKSKSRHGRRTPFIVAGTIVAVAAFISLSFVDAAQLQKIDAVAAIDDTAALETIYNSDAAKVELNTPEGDTFVLTEAMSKEDFLAIRMQLPDGTTNPEYTNFVVPARQAYTAQVTERDPSSLILFIALLLIVLVAMATFRSPAVALMPDVTVKPLRSKANAIINLMGTAGGIVVLVLGMVFSTTAIRNAMMTYTVFFGVVGGIMLAALAVFLLTVREPKWAAEMQEASIRLGIEEKEEVADEKRGLSKNEKWSLLFLLASIVLWFFGYNAITSKYSVYAANVLDKDYNFTMIIAQAAAVVAYVPVGLVASRIGRKKTIMAGVVMLAVAFGAASFIRSDSPMLLINALFALAGIAWATINVNSFPMVVEMCSGADVGKYTGFYYTASMAAQTLTPMVSGYLMDELGMTVLFPYGTIFVALAFVTMALVRHGDSKIIAKKGLEAFDNDD
ncbi:MAG: SLC45 family MFS transporter [Ruminococcaceae bacterium]|nr:SLC45 family MFS transporter [Oscillospiraceae bacterium]